MNHASLNEGPLRCQFLQIASTMMRSKLLESTTKVIRIRKEDFTTMVSHLFITLAARCSMRTRSIRYFSTKTPASRSNNYRPPMPRLTAQQNQWIRAMANNNSSAVESSSSSASSSKSGSGSWLIRGSYFVLALLGVDWFLQYQEQSEARVLLASLAEETKEQRRKMEEEWSKEDVVSLYKCRVIQSYAGMGGSHGLQGPVRSNDVLEVLQERVGPDKLYHMCRSRNSDGTIKSVGWYPIAFMKRQRRWTIW